MTIHSNKENIRCSAISISCSIDLFVFILMIAEKLTNGFKSRCLICYAVNQNDWAESRNSMFFNVFNIGDFDIRRMFGV